MIRMSQSNPLLAVGAVLAVAALGAVVWWPQPTEPPLESSLEARVLALEEEVVTLREQVARSRAGRSPGVGGRGGRGGSTASAAFLGDDVRSARSIGRGARGAAPDVLLDAASAEEPLDSRVGQLVREQLKEEREERMERRRDRMEARTAQRLDQLATDAGLSPGQVDELEAALTLEREEVIAVFRAAREDGSFGEAREKMESIKEETDAKVGGLLEGTQLDAWNAYREEEDARRR